MNKIFRIVWSQATQSWVVVSELTKAHKKQSSSNSQGSAVKFSGNFIKSSAVALALLSGHSAYAATAGNTAGEGYANTVAFGANSKATGGNSVALGTDAKAEKNNGVAIGKGAQSTEDSAIALGFQSKSTGNWSVAVGLLTKATDKQAVAVGPKSEATGENSIAIGHVAKASKESSVALGSSAESTNNYTTAVGGTAFANHEGATALGYGARATAKDTIAIGKSAKAEQEGVLALGAQAYAKAADTIAIGNSAAAKKDGDIILGKDAKSRDQGGGRSVAIGFKATAGSNRNKFVEDDKSTGLRGDDGSVAIGTNAYTGLNKNNTAINSSVALGAGAGVGYRAVGDDGKPLGVGTDADDNDTVLVKAFGGTKATLTDFNNSGTANAQGFFSFQGVDINEGTALGRNTRAMGDQSVAIGAQSVAGQGSIVIGGNDIQAYDGKKYFKAKNPNSGDAKGVNDFNAETTPGTGKDGQPITITKKYEELVGVGLDRSWRASYGQDGSTVIGMQAHSTTPLGVAIGTNSIVRKGAFGSTAIGSGASVVANAEAAVAIGMGAEAQGNYAVAAGTAARAKESAVAAGYQSKAEESAVAVGDHAEAVNASVAVGQLAKAKKVADIAVGQGAVASGEQGAIAVGLGTQAQGDSSIMIGGSEINKVAAQKVTYQKEKKDAQGHAVIKTTKKKELIGGEEVDRTIRSVEMVGATGTIQEAYGELTNGATLNTTKLDYSLAANKNGHGSISMGIHSLSTGDLGTAIGTGARVTKLGGVALGTGAISELQNGVAIGTGSRADANSIGTRQTDISYNKDGHIVPFDSKDVAYTFYWAGGVNTSEGDVVSFGTPGAERQLKNVAAGRIADDSTDAINGSQLNSVTKRMSSGWAVEAEKDKDSSGVLKLNGAAATAGTEVHSADGKTTKRENDGTATGHVDKVRLNDEVKIRVGDNLVLNQEDATRAAYEDPDNPDRKTGTRVTSKFTYSLNPELKKLKSAEFKNDAGDTTNINGAGVTVTPVTAGKQPVSLTTTGLNNGGNAISNVAGNLPETKNNDATTGASNATTSQAAPTLGNAANQVNPTNAATVSDVLNAGWNLQGNNQAVDFVKPYDTVNFVNGDGTRVTVESADGKTSTVKYSVNLGNGLEKDTDNKITVKAADKSLTVGNDGVKVNPADKSLEVTDAGLKVKAGDNTLTTDTNGLKVNTGAIEPVTTGTNPGTVKVKDGDTGKIATVDSVVNAVNSAAWTATSAATSAGELGAAPTDQSVKAGDKVTFEADKNIKITQAGSKFTFATKDNVSFDTVQVGGEQGPKLSKSDAGDLKVSGSNGTDPVKITNVQDGTISADSKDAINGSQFHKLANNTIQLKGQTGDSAATETNKQALNKENGIAFTIKSSDGTLLEVSAADDTITLKPKTATLTTGADGVPTADTTNGKLVTADQLVNTLTEMGWKAIADKDGSGTVSGAATELIKAGNTVTFKAGDNLSVKQDGKNFIYSLQKELTGLTSAEFKNQAGDKTVINSDGVTITPVTNGKQPVSLTNNGLDNGGNAISNVKSNLPDTKNNDATTGPSNATKTQAAPNTTNKDGDKYINPNNAATVSDVLNAGWNLQGNGKSVDFVKPYDNVNFVNGLHTTAVVSTVDGITSNVTYNVTGLPITYTDKDGNPVSKIGDKFYKVNDKGQPLDSKGNPSTKVNNEGKPVDDAGNVIDPIDTANNPVKTSLVNPAPEANKTGTTSPTTLDNVTSKLENYKADPVNGKEPAKNSLRDLTNTNVTDNTVATVGDIRNMGWIVSSDKNTDDLTKDYSETVKNANEVKFVGVGSAIVSGKTDGNVRTITVKVDDQTSTNNSVTPVNYTKADGTKVYPKMVTNPDTGKEELKFFENADGTGAEVPKGDVVTSINGPEGTTSPTTLKNVKNNLPNVNDGSKTITDKDGKEKAGDVANINKAPLTAAEAAKLSNPKTKDGQVNPNYIGNNAATVSDVLNAGWNLQGNGKGVDFVKPYDTVNFRDGGNTTVTVTTDDNLTSHVQVNVTGLPVANTITDPKTGKEVPVVKVGDTFYPANSDGTPNIVKDKDGNPTNGYVRANDGKLYPREDVDVTPAADPTKPATVTPKAGKTPTTVNTNLANPNVANTTDNPGNNVNTPSQLGNVANGANTFSPVDADGKEYVKANNGKYYAPDKVNEDGSLKEGTDADADAKDPLVLANDGKWYKSSEVAPNGTPADTATPVEVPKNVDAAGLVDFSNSNPNNAATVGDLQNLGWIVSAEGNKYSDQVRNANEVKFVGEGTATVTGKTDENGVRTITVKVDDQVSTNNAQTPVVYTDKDGKKVYPIKGDDGTVTYHTTPDGKGDNDEVVPNNNVVTSINGPEGTTSPTELKNVKNNIPAVKDADKKVTNPDGTEKGTAGDVANISKAPLTATEAADLLNPTKDGKPNPNFVGNNAATVSDVLNAGWNLQNNGEARDFVKPFDTVNFVNGGNTTAVVTTAADGTTSDVTFNVTGLPIATTIATPNGPVQLTKVGDNYYPVNADGTPNIQKDENGNPTNGYVKADDGKYYPASDVIFAKDPNTQATKVTPKDGKEPVTFGNSLTNPNVVNTADAPNKSVAAPTTLNNVKSNLPTVNDADKKAYDVNGAPIDGKNNTAAPITAADAADLLNPTKDGKPNPKFAGNNAATVSDVLNAGWNLQNNGEARDFVKPYDTVNFVDGANTTAVVTTNEDGTTSNVTYNVTGLPVTFTDKDGKPVSKIGDKYYPVNEKGEPVSEQGNPAVGKNEAGDLVDKDGNVIKPIDTKANPLQSNLVNPNVENTKEKPNNQTTTPTQLGNVANGAETFKPADNVKLANDGKWYPADKVESNGQPKTGAAPVPLPANIGKAGLIDFSNSNPNNAATVGDLQNLGWIVSAPGNNYSDQVRNANEVKFVGEGTASVTGKTDENGVRTITVKVDDQVSTNNAQTPVNYTNKDGKKVYPVKDENGNVTYHTTPDGKGKGDETVPAGDVITSLNGPEGTTTPTTLNNVKNNIPSVNDADKKVTNPDGTEKGTAGNVANINKAPLTATEAADLLNPTKDGKPNPNFAGNNAATVSDVLNAGWNLQNNGEARDFVKPFDTVNFVNGGNTTAVVTTAADGTTSDVTFNVTGLPITYTTADGKPVSKVGDKYYPVNEKGQPIGPDGKPAVKTAPNGDLLDAAGNVIQPINTAKEPLKSNLVNPNVANTADASNNQTTTPTQLGNVANGAETFKPAEDVKLANDGKWYPADKVEPNGKPKEGATPVASPLVTKNAAGDVLEKGNDGNWYKSSDLENGNPKPNATEQTPKSKPDNADKAGLINFENSNPNNAATVGDLQNMGFVVSAKDNGYTEQMRNANKVEFKGDNGVQVTGKTLADGTREITVALKEGRVTNDVLITDKDGTVTHGVRGEDGKIYTKDPKTGKATKEEIPVKPSDTVENDGNAYVTGNSVATAIQKSGWNIGIGSTDKAFSEEAKTYERVNPKDNVKYVNGANTTVSMAVDAAEDKNGDTVTTTYVKVDVNRDLHIDSVTAGGPAKDGKPGKDGAMTVKDAKGNDGVSATAKDGKGTLTLKDAGKDGKDASQVDISTAKAPADLENTPKDAVRANDGNWYTPADVTVEVKDGKTVVTPKAGKTPIPNAPTMDRIQYTGTDGKPRNVATMDDGLRFVGDDGETISKPLNSTMEFTGGNRENGKPVAKADTTTGNIGVFHDNGKLSVQLAKDLEKMNSANFETPDGTSTKITGNGLSVTPETAKLKDPKTGKPILDKDGNPKVDSKKVVSFGGPTIMKDPKTGKPVVDSKTGKPVMESGISAGGQVMTNVAPGRISPTSTDAVNGSQLHAVASNLNNKINKVGKHADAGTASALAASNIPQAYTPGKSLVGIAAGSYQGQTGVAVGMSRISDNGKIIIRLSGTTNTQGRAGVAAGVGYQW